MNSIFDIINVPLGYVFKWIYLLVQNYGWTIILFTLVTKLILFPLTLKQQKSMKKTQALQPKLAKLQEKYQYDKEKLSQETMKLYQESGVNPMGGCLPMLIQFPILIALYNIIREPLYYVLMLGKDQVAQVAAIVGGDVNNQIDLANKMSGFIGEITNQLGGTIHANDLINFNFFGLNLSETPSIDFIFNQNNIIYVLIPLLAGLTTFLVSKISAWMNKTPTSGNDENPAQSSMKMMNVLFPVMTTWFAISLPAGLGIYWIASNVLQILQMIIMNKFIKVDMPVEQGPQHFRERKKKKK